MLKVIKTTLVMLLVMIGFVLPTIAALVVVSFMDPTHSSQMAALFFMFCVVVNFPYSVYFLKMVEKLGNRFNLL